MTRQEVIEEVYQILWNEFARDEGGLRSSVMPRVFETLKTKIPDKRATEMERIAIDLALEEYKNALHTTRRP